MFTQPDKAEPFLPEEWDPTTAPLFAMGPPRLTTGEAQQVVEVLKVVGNDVSEVYEMLRPIVRPPKNIAGSELTPAEYLCISLIS